MIDLHRSFSCLLLVLLVLGMGSALLTAGFDSVPRFIGSASLPRDPTPHDVDGDGDLDLVYLDGNESDTNLTEIGWFENSNAGTSWTRHVLATGYRGPATLKMVDLGNDGRVDLLVGLRTGYQLLLFRHLGGSRFAPARVLGDNLFGLEDIDAADLNNDGLLDLIIASDTGPRWMRQIPGLNFAPPVVIANNLGTFSEPQVVEPHDFDGDGDIDLVIAVADSDRLIYCRNNGNGAFAAPVNLDTSHRTYALDAGDLDGDGHIDIVSAARDFDNPEVFWLKNNGNGTFARKRLLTTGVFDVAAVVILDVDSDGDLDIASALYRGPVFWLENRGRGSFLAQQRIGDGGDFMFHLTKGDLDGDGDEDLVAAQWDSDRFVWYRNTSPIPTIDPPRIEFFRADDTSVASSATMRWQTSDAASVEITPNVGTVPATGSRTISLNATQTFTITARNTIGTVTAELTIVVGEPPLIRSFAALDDTVARNSLADLSWDVVGAESISLDPAPGPVSGSSFQPVMTETTAFTLRATNEFGERTATQTVTVGDPPTLDMLGAAPSTIALNSVSLLSWNATGADTAFVSGVGEVPVGQAIAVQPASTTTYTITVSNAFGSASRTVTVTVSGNLYTPDFTVIANWHPNTYSTALADLNGDGLEDVLVLSPRTSTEPTTLRWLPRTGPGTFGPPAHIATRPDSGFFPFARDLDGDGDIDAGITGSGPLQWAPNNGNGASFGALRIVTTLPTGSSRLVIGDLDGDAFPDIVGSFADSLRVFPGAANGAFGPEQFIDDFGGSVEHVYYAAADFDGDGDTDLVAGKDSVDGIFWYENEEGIFTNKRPVPSVSNRLFGMDAVDTDNDGDFDIIAKIGSSRLQFLINPGDGDFTNVQPRLLDSNVSSISDLDFVDFDLDGDLDLILLGRDLELQENVGGNNFRVRQSFEFATRVIPKRMSIGDIDSDGDPDIVAAETSGNRVVTYENQYVPAAAPSAVNSFPSFRLEEDFGESRILLHSLFEDPDTPADQLRFSILESSTGALLTSAGISATGELILQSALNRNGEGNVLIRATDPKGLLATADLSIHVQPVDDPPVASDLSIRGAPLAGATLRSDFTYIDIEQDAPGAHLYQWFRADHADGSGRVDIPGATQANYILTAEDVGKHVGFDVTPVAATGDFPTGKLVTSTTVGPIDKAPTSLIITSDTPDPSFVADTVALQFTLSYDSNLITGAPTGTVTIAAPGALPVVVPVPASSGGIVLPKAGTQDLSITYSGDGAFHGSSDIESHLVYSQVWISMSDPAASLEDDARTFEATISRNGDNDTDLEVSLAISGSASFDSDYTLSGATTTSAMIPAGGNDVTISLATLVENLEEPDETIVITLQSAARYSLLDGQTVAAATVLNDDYAPVAIADPLYSVVEDNLLVVSVQQGVLLNDTDQDDGDGPDHLTAHLREEVLNGVLLLRADGSFDYAPDPDSFGPDSFTYVASDGTNFSEPIQVDIEVTELVDLRLTSTESRDVVGAPGSVTHTVTVENLGPSDATDVVVDLLPVFPAGVTQNTPVFSTGSLSGSQWMLALAENQSGTLQVTYVASSESRGGIDVITTTARVNSLAQPLANEGDDQTSVSSSIISPPDIGVLELDASPKLDLRSALFTQEITVTNNNPLPLAGFRLLINGLPDDVQVYNAHVSAAGGAAIIESNSDLGVGESVTLTIEFFRPNLDPNISPVYSIEAVYSEDPAEPTAAATGAALDRMLWLENGDFLIEFTSTPGEAYAIEYSHDMNEWHRVVPSITAAANRTQWIDAGPPKTASHPSSGNSRYYRIVPLHNLPN